MKYNLLKKAAIGISIMALPYICGDGCNYSPIEPGKARAETITKNKTIEDCIEDARATNRE